jgi:cell division septation protein DedD
LPLVLIATLAASGCDGNGKLSFGGNRSGDTATAAPATSVQLVETDVEAPSVFQITESGLWDGRPSLGGVWVAHPDVTDPERVIIRNPSNGKFVIGALFRRERENPGPALQVSSDAAAALDLLAGAPASLNVTALRREDAPQAAPEATVDFGVPGTIEATPLDPIAGAAAAIDAAEASAAPTATPNTAPAPTGTPAAPANTGSLSKPFIQIGIFSVEANANRTAEQMRASNLTATVLQQSSQGRTFWRVIVGPSATESARADLLTKVKAQGFADAYFVAN